MDYVTPPRGALVLLNFFATDPDFANIFGDLSEELQQRASSEGRPAALRWFWLEALRNAKALAARELFRTPIRVLGMSLLTAVSLDLAVNLVIVPLLGSISRAHRLQVKGIAWIPNQFWAWYQAIFLVVVATFLTIGLGAMGSLVVKAREFALAVSFAMVCTLYNGWVLYILSYSFARGRLPGDVNLSHLIERVLLELVAMIMTYSIGCFWVRRRRIARLTYRAN